MPFSSDADIVVHGKRQNSENLGLLDVYTVEKNAREAWEWRA
jgi:hypothetical protein